jgi:magnesium-transporting ATPase (P-type)
VFLKGAPEIVIEHCTSYINKDGDTAELTEAVRENMMNEVVVEQFAKNAYRTLLIAYRDISFEEYETMKSDNNNF